MGIKLTQRSLDRLAQVHHDLAEVMTRAAAMSTIDFVVIEGLRTIERQRELVAKGASRTLKSRHLPGKDGKARAVDIAPVLGGQVQWAWPLYFKLAPIIKAAAAELSVPIEWGGDWRTFKDGPHWQLPWKDYP